MIDKSKHILVIVESPNKVSHIKEYLKKAGYTNLSVMASVGHIMHLADGGTYRNSGIEPTQDFKLDLQISYDKKDIVNNLKTQVKVADYVYICSDPDREGFVIAWSLIKFLNIPEAKCFRAVTHEITPKAVVAAIENPIPMDYNLVDAGLARMTIDKMTGYSLSPVARTYIGAKSVGRCQSAGLKLIVDREKEIQNFKPDKYFDLYVNFNKNNTEFKAKYVGTDIAPLDHLKTQAEVDKVKKECISDYIVKDITKKEKQESPKPPFCTATFQQEVNSKLNLTVKDAMSVAQKLFETGNITYMRTDDTEFSPEFIPVLKAYIDKACGTGVYTDARKGKKTGGEQEGHECLRVTDPTLTPDKFAEINTNDLQRKVYKLIWQRTIAACLPNARISETTYNIYNNMHKFNLVSNEVIDEGYRRVYNYKDDEAEDEGLVKETFVKNEKLLNTTLEEQAKETKPPARFKESTFIKELQKREVGRPSTYATIVETVLSESRGYCKLENKQMVPTDRGIALIDFLDRSFSNIINIDYTKEMEKDLDLIASGKLKKLDFLNTFYHTLEDTISKNTEMGMQGEAKTCPLCGKILILRRSKYGKLFYGCDYPRCKYTESLK